MGERDGLARANQFAADFFEHALWKSTRRRAPASTSPRAESRRKPPVRSKSDFAPEQPVKLARALEKRGLPTAALELGLVKQRSAPARAICFAAR